MNSLLYNSFSDSLKETILRCHSSVSKKISDLKGVVVDCVNKIKKLSSKIENTPLQAMEALDTIGDEDSELIQLPCATMNDFEKFNDLIRLNREYRNKIVSSSLLSLISRLFYKIKTANYFVNSFYFKKIKISKSINKKRSMTRCLGDIIRQFVSANVGKLLVPVKATPGKTVFKSTTIYSLLEGIYFLNLKDCTYLIRYIRMR